LHQGKALGGSSAVNAQVFAPPTKTIIDGWAELGNEGWNWDALRDYYSRVFTPPSVPEALRKQLGVDGLTANNQTSNGPIHLSFPGDPSHPIREAWAETFRRKGYLMGEGPWAQASVGAFSNFASVDPDKRERSYAGNAYYDLAKNRDNLHVLTEAHVEKILFEEGHAAPRAIGVKYRHGGESKTATALKEVIISAGALQSPKLLQLSGVGDRVLLDKFKIKVVKDLPAVGENLLDHLICGVSYVVAEEAETLDKLTRQELEAFQEAVRLFAGKREDLLTSSGIKTYAYLPIVEYHTEGDRETLEELMKESSPNAGDLRARAYHDLADKMLFRSNEPSGAYLTALSQSAVAVDSKTRKRRSPFAGKHFTIATILSHPLSRGSVRIASDNPTQYPEIDPNYLSHPVDAEIFAQHMLYLDKIACSAPFSDLLKEPVTLAFPPTPVLDVDAAKKHIKERAISMWHPAGTCAMLPENMGGVVDTELRVYGVKGLRVVDASVVPLLPAGNLQSTVYAVAERAADIIKGAYGLK